MTQPETEATAVPAADSPNPEPGGPSGAEKPPTDAPPSGAGPRVQVRVNLFARTDVGQVREHNEDNFLVADLTQRSRGLAEPNRTSTVGPLGHLFAVCDGMGGAAAGEVASQLAVDIIFERMVDGLDQRSAIARDEIARRLVRAVETAGLRIFQEAKADRSRRGMGTTVTASTLVDDHLFFAQVGDSRGYILRDNVLTQVTRDQSLVNQLIEAGQLTAEEAETFEHNNIILQALGTSDTVQVDLTFVQVRHGDMMLLCSDGLSGMVRFDEIREIMSSAGDPAEICKSLIERANFAGGHDNVTVIIAKFEGESLAVDPSQDPLKYRKYTLPEDPDASARSLRPASEVPADAPSDSGMYSALDDTTEAAARARRGDGWHEAGPHVSAADERIDIPGTHVPAGVVVVIVVGVVGLLAATAFFLLR